MATDVYDLYNSLLEMESSTDDVVVPDGEDFITSKDIAKMKEESEEENPILQDVKKKEESHFKRFTSRRQHKYTESEMEAIREGCRNTIVHDYGTRDIYHMSDEERAKNDMLAEVSLKLSKLKRTYRRLDQYIEAMRVVYEAWEILSKSNYVHTKDEFFRMVAEGQIVSNRIIMPKLKGMNKYNIDTIIEYISHPEMDVSKFAPKQVNDYFLDDEEDESEEEQMYRLLSEEEVKMILDEESIPSMEVSNLNRKFIKGYDKNVVFKSKKKVKGSKKEREIRQDTSDMLMKIQNGVGKGYGTYSYSLTNSIFRPDKKEKASEWDKKLFFDGSWRKKSDVEVYNLAIIDTMLDQKISADSFVTVQNQHINAVCSTLTDLGIEDMTVRTFTNQTKEGKNKEDRKKILKSNRKTEKMILQRIINLNNKEEFKKEVKKIEKKYNDYTNQ